MERGRRGAERGAGENGKHSEESEQRDEGGSRGKRKGFYYFFLTKGREWLG